MNREVEIYPLSAKNEIYINNPDHLLSGEASRYSIVECSPNIGDVLNLPYMDMEAISMGIKKASYGNEINLPYKCPHCKHEATAIYSIDYIFSQMKQLPENFICDVDGLKIYLKPFPLECYDQFKLIYTNEKIAENALSDTELTKEEKAKSIYDSIQNISTISTESVGKCIIRIETETDEVTDQTYIIDYFNNAPVKHIKAIMKKHNEFSEYGLPRNVNVECEGCNKEFEYPMTYDPSSFFD